MLKITERKNVMTMKNNFTEADMKAFEPAEKVGIIATVTPRRSSPHVASDICYGGKTRSANRWRILSGQK